MKVSDLYNLVEKYEQNNESKERKNMILSKIIDINDCDIAELTGMHYTYVNDLSEICELPSFVIDNELIMMYKYPELMNEYKKEVTEFIDEEDSETEKEQPEEPEESEESEELEESEEWTLNEVESLMMNGIIPRLTSIDTSICLNLFLSTISVLSSVTLMLVVMKDYFQR